MAYLQLKFYTSIDTDCIWKFFRLCKCTGECEALPEDGKIRFRKKYKIK